VDLFTMLTSSSESKEGCEQETLAIFFIKKTQFSSF
jgi:hypothetical protein